jgi:hypothetical protein
MSKRETFDLETFRIDPNDPKWRPKAAPAKKKWRRQFIKFPWAWMDLLRATTSGSAYRLALILVYEHWRTGGRPIMLSNIAAEKEGLSRHSKWRALRELEKLGLVVLEKRPRKSPTIRLMMDTLAADLKQ